MKDFVVLESDTVKICKTNDSHYSYVFDKETGLFVRNGKDKKTDPIMAPAPEILDIEISSGSQCSNNCEFCYKDNQSDQSEKRPLINMSLDTFKTIINKFPKVLTQIAFGIMDIKTNPEFFPMMEYARELGYIPNYTTNGRGIGDAVARQTVKLCGAVAISVTSTPKDMAYEAIERYLRAGMKQVNIHFMLCNETYVRALEVINEVKEDRRLDGVNAIVFLGYKPKGRNRDKFTPIGSVQSIERIVKAAEDNGVGIGFDSCSAPVALKVYEKHKEFEKTSQLIEPCESGLFSSYVNAEGCFFPCSFMEGQKDWEQGISVIECKDFIEDVWKHPRTEAWRKKLLESTNACDCSLQKICRACPAYDITPCKEKK